MKQSPTKTLYLAFFLLLYLPAIAQVPGTLDSSFAINGVQTLVPTTEFENAYAVEILSDGNILVGGASETSGDGNWDIILYRLKKDGSVDSTFGNNGYIYHDHQDYSQYVRNMKRQSNGKILFVGGLEDDNFQVDAFVTRLNEDGSPDLDFGDNGTTIISVGSGEDLLNNLVIQNDGKIIAGGTTGVPGFTFSNSLILRLNEDGTLDNSFGTDGMVITDPGSENAGTWDLILNEDGSIITAGYSGALYYNVLMEKLTKDGIHDSTFSGDGINVINFGSGSDIGYAIVRHPLDGRILVGGQKSIGTSKSDHLVFAVTETGLIDSSFGINGVTSIHVSNTDATLDMAVQTNGKIVVGGTSGTGFGNIDFLVGRYNQDGSIDSTFGTNGYTLSVISSFFSEIEDIAIQPDGKIVAVGIAANNNNDMGIVRYHGDGVPTAVVVVPEVMPGSLSVYPNPSAGSFNLLIDLENNENGLLTVKVWNHIGQLVYTEEVTAASGKRIQPVHTGDQLPSGSYLLQVLNGNTVLNTSLAISR